MRSFELRHVTFTTAAAGSHDCGGPRDGDVRNRLSYFMMPRSLRYDLTRDKEFKAFWLLAQLDRT
jgi:hypothetical protein